MSIISSIKAELDPNQFDSLTAPKISKEQQEALDAKDKADRAAAVRNGAQKTIKEAIEDGEITDPILTGKSLPPKGFTPLVDGLKPNDYVSGGDTNSCTSDPANAID